MEGVLRAGVLVVVLLGVLLVTAPTASAHRLGLAAAKSIGEQLGAEGCERSTVHRVACEWYYEEWPENGEPYDWSDYDDLVLAGSRLYLCDAGKPCSKKAKPLTLTNLFRGRTPTGRAEIAVEMAARGRGGYFVPVAFYTFGFRFEGLRPGCTFADGHVERRALWLEGRVVKGHIHAHEEFDREDLENYGETVVRSSTGVARLTGVVTLRRLTAVASLSERFNDQTACSVTQQLSLRPEWKAPRYVEP